MSRSIVLDPAAGTKSRWGARTRALLARRGPTAALGHVLSVVSQHGANRLAIPVTEAWYNRRLGIDADQIQDTRFSRGATECNRYEATPWLSFHRAMRHVNLRPDGEVFVDFGCGMGKVLAMAARMPFSRVIGVEFCPELSDEARLNLERMRDKLPCPDVQVVTSDAISFEIPEDVSVAFLFNPFEGSILSQVCDNLRRSAERSAKPLRIVYANPRHFEEQVAGADWLRKTAEFQHRVRWVVYETTRAAPRRASELDAAA